MLGDVEVDDGPAMVGEHDEDEEDAPDGRAIERPEMGRVVQVPEVGGQHHRYARQAA